MISKLYINIDDKLILFKFSINKLENKIIISCNKELIKIPIYNSYNGLDYMTINMPLELIIYNENIFNPYVIISSSNLDINNDIDFFYNLELILNNKYNLQFFKYKDIKLSYIQNYNTNNTLWLKINLLKLLFIHSNNYFSKEYKILSEQLKNLKYNIYPNDTEIKFTYNEWCQYSNHRNNIKFNNLMKDNYYYILINNENIKKIKILNINEDKFLIKINNNDEILYSNYKWFHYYPNNKLNKDFINYNFYLNYNINLIFLKFIIGNEKLFNYEDILSYYYNCNNKLSNIKTLDNIDDITLIEKKSITDNYFEELIKKSDEDEQFKILKTLFNNYNYPLKINRHEIDDTFDYIIYTSLYNYKNIYKNDTLKSNILDIIPVKLKNLYLNMFKLFINVINNAFDNITYNQKFYNDYLHRNIIKLYLINSSKISVKLFKDLVSNSSYNKFKDIFSRNLLLYDISYKLTWNNLSKKLNYLNIFYKNLDIVFYQNKINKNIISDNVDIKIKKIIENPLEMYKYLKKEKDFIKWTRFIIDKLNTLYHIPIIINHNNDIINIAKIIFLLVNINEQNMKDLSYFNFITFCIKHSHLILNNTRINLKIKENFNNLKCNINLGYLAKDLTWQKNCITFDNDTKISNNINLNLEMEDNLKIAIDKYLKYKGKYLKSKNNNIIK